MAYQYTRLGGPSPASSRRFPLVLGGAIFLVFICLLFWYNGSPDLSTAKGYQSNHSPIPTPTLVVGDPAFDSGPKKPEPPAVVSSEPTSATTTDAAAAATASYAFSDDAAKLEDMARLHCPDDPLADEIFVVLKTGATAARERLPVHFYTTMRCVKNYAIFSDLAEEISGHKVIDAFNANTMINKTVMDTYEEFGLYKELQELHRNHADTEAIEKLQEGDGPFKEDGRGWKLDKWKFLPIVEKTLQLSREAQWYLFIEADSYIMWSNLLQWLKNFDSGEPWYLGGQAMLGDLIFGHGGTGWLISNPAAKGFVQQVRENQEHYVERVHSFCCGDANVADVFRDIGIPLHGSWPTLQGENPSSLDYTDRIWCWAAVSFHHMSPSDITALWEFEQRWLGSENASQPIRHSDVFNEFVKPHTTYIHDGWDNISKDRIYNMEGLKENGEDKEAPPGEEMAHMSLEDCQAVCEKHLECIQYSYEPGVCSLGHAVRLGRESDNKSKQSGWMTDRVEELVAKLQPCKTEWATK